MFEDLENGATVLIVGCNVWQLKNYADTLKNKMPANVKYNNQQMRFIHENGKSISLWSVENEAEYLAGIQVGSVYVLPGTFYYIEFQKYQEIISFLSSRLRGMSANGDPKIVFKMDMDT